MVDFHHGCVYYASPNEERSEIDTASWIAAIREREYGKQAPLFVDAYAKYFTSEGGSAILRGSDREAASENKALLVRIKYFDDFVEERAPKYHQIVSIG